MRPRRIRRGNPLNEACQRCVSLCFNEAAANSPRKPARGLPKRDGGSRFNEAAANSPRKPMTTFHPASRKYLLQ